MRWHTVRAVQGRTVSLMSGLRAGCRRLQAEGTCMGAEGAGRAPSKRLHGALLRSASIGVGSASGSTADSGGDDGLSRRLLIACTGQAHRPKLSDQLCRRVVAQSPGKGATQNDETG